MTGGTERGTGAGAIVEPVCGRCVCVCGRGRAVEEGGRAITPTEPARTGDRRERGGAEGTRECRLLSRGCYKRTYPFERTSGSLCSRRQVLADDTPDVAVTGPSTYLLPHLGAPRCSGHLQRDRPLFAYALHTGHHGPHAVVCGPCAAVDRARELVRHQRPDRGAHARPDVGRLPGVAQPRLDAAPALPTSYLGT